MSALMWVMSSQMRARMEALEEQMQNPGMQAQMAQMQAVMQNPQIMQRMAELRVRALDPPAHSSACRRALPQPQPGSHSDRNDLVPSSCVSAERLALAYLDHSSFAWLAGQLG